MSPAGADPPLTADQETTACPRGLELTSGGNGVRRTEMSGRPPARRWVSYAMAAVLIGVALALQLLAQPYVRPTPFLAIFGAVMAASRYGGLGPGLLATVLGGVAADVLFLSPAATFALAPADLVTLGLYTVIAVLICVLSQDLRRSQAALLRSNQELEARVEVRTRDLVAAHRELEQFSYSVSHDLQAPLRAVDGFASILQEALGPDAAPGVARPLARIRAAAAGMKNLVDDLLDLARVARAEMKRERVDVSQLAWEVVGDLERAPPEREVEVVVEEGLEVQADPALVQVVLVNLLSNAWKFTSRTVAPRIEVCRAPAQSGFCAFLVRDNGAGFDPTYSAKLFEPFERLHTQSEYPGSGIGLAIVRNIVFRHGGTVSADGAVERGATFTTVWPTDTPTEPTPAEAEPRRG